MKTRIFSCLLVLMMIPMLFAFTACSDDENDLAITSARELAIIYPKPKTVPCRAMDYRYKYRIDLTGHYPNEASKGHMIVLTNDPKLTYNDVIYSLTTSKLDDTLKPDMTVIVEMGDETTEW